MSEKLSCSSMSYNVWKTLVFLHVWKTLVSLHVLKTFNVSVVKRLAFFCLEKTLNKKNTTKLKNKGYLFLFFFTIPFFLTILCLRVFSLKNILKQFKQKRKKNTLNKKEIQRLEQKKKQETQKMLTKKKEQFLKQKRLFIL